MRALVQLNVLSHPAIAALLAAEAVDRAATAGSAFAPLDALFLRQVWGRCFVDFRRTVA
jgi:hypothetical protein